MELIRNRLKQIAERFLEEEGFELVDVLVGGAGNNPRVQFFIDREGGIAAADCAAVTRALSDLLDREAIFERAYRLEVSSPGLDRPLKTEKDFLRNIGKDVVVDCLSGDGSTRRFTGVILHVEDGRILFKTEGETVSVPLASVVKAKIKLKW